MLESYIAPLLMGYVDKYVLNLKPSDLSLSVWGGDVVLHNLELNLPLLQKELNLPIHFLSGKIYKLQIHVPWTKLIYEPVTITINTMEFIVTLKESSSDTSTNDAQEESESHVQPPPPINDDNLPPGYVQSILNKVINNVAFKIENIILKYVEDDIVFSVNVKSVELFSADSSWNRAFTELTLPELVLRKICNLTDVTICLDQQSSNGRIDVYQDPILYKSSLTCRILSKYNSLKGIKTESINFDVFCESLDFSITDQQIPLLLRLLLLAKGLFYGTLDLPGCEFRKHSGTSIVMEEKRRVEGSKNMSVESNESLDTSWTAWAWSLIPGQDDPSNYTGKPSKPETKHFRAYIAQLTLILKKTTQMSNTVTSQRLEFTPILCTEISGFMVEFISIGQHLIDLRCGIQKLVGYSFGNQCVCTVISEDLNEDQEASNNVNNIQDEVFISIGDDSMLHQPNFLQKSLFAEQDNIENEKPALNSSSSTILEEPSMENSFLAVESGDIEIKEIANDSKVESSDYLLKNDLTHENYGSIFCSYFYEMEIPENKSPNEIENIFLYPERDDKVNEISSKNLAIAHCDIFITTSLKHIVDWLIEVMLADMPKRKEKTEIFLDPFCMQQLEIGNFLSSTLNVNVSNIQFFLLANDHFTGMFTDSQVNEAKQDGLMLRIEELNVLRTDPMYPVELSYLHENQRLVKLHKVANLQTKVNTKVTGCEFGLSVVDRSSLSKNNQLILQPLNLNLEISLPIQTLSLKIMERFVKIAPKPSQYQSQSLDVDLFGQRKPDKRQSFDLIKIMRETLFSKYGRDPWVDELPININKSELAKKKKEVIDELKADDEEIVESEVNYLWKCAIFSLRNWAILSQINAKHKISVWYIRKLLDGVIPENLIHAALEAWLKEAKPTSARLVEIKENVLHASQIEPKDLRYLDQTKDKKIQSLQYEVENWRLKYESVYAELQKFKISEERNLQVLSAMRAEVLECQQENSNLKRQIAQLRQFESLQEKRLKNLEKNSSLSILSPNKISTPQTVKPSQNETEDSVIHREDVAAQNISSIDGIAPLDQSIEEALNFSEPILDKAAEKLEACLMASIPSESNNISVETDFNVIAETEVHDEPIGNPEPIFNTVETITQRIDVEVDVEKLELTRRAIKIEKTTSKKKKSTAIEKKTVTKKPKTDDKTVESVPENIDVAKKELHVGDWVCVCWRDAGAYFGKVTDIDKNKNICDATFLKRKFGNMYNMSTLTESFEMSQVIAFSFDVVYESKNAWKVTFNEKMLKDLFKKWKYESFL